MLVLTRNKMEVVVLQDEAGEEIGRVKVVDIRGDKVRLGFEFPASVKVHRSEVAAALRESARGAAHGVRG